jgi:hypothetical protein
MSTPQDAPYKRQQRVLEARADSATLLQPTLPERIARLNPSERYELQQIVRSLKLRKIIKRTLVEAFWSYERQQQVSDDALSMHQLRKAVRAHGTLTEAERVLASAVDSTTFAPNVTHYTHERHVVPGSVSSPAIERVLVNSMKEVP